MLEQGGSLNQRRRLFLKSTACGLGSIALHQLLAQENPVRQSTMDAVNPLAVKAPHFKPRAKNVIFIFMSGGPSQMDLFDPKPKLKKLHGQPVPESFLKGINDALIKSTAQVMASPRTFKKYGEAGLDFSDNLPHLGTCADDLCMIRTVHTDVSNHHPAQMLMNSGSTMFDRPSMGSWVTYGLGSESENLPGYVVLLSNSGKGVDGGSSLWSNGILPSTYRGVTFRSRGEAILYLSNPEGMTPPLQRERLDAIRDLNTLRFDQTGDPEIASRIASYELAYRMQTSAPELLDFSDESQATLKMYGIENETTNWFGSNALLARRMIERGVRFVQLYHSTWDDHSNLNKNLKTNCDMTDQPSAALIKDLKQRGLLEDTLVIWGGEFGRTPMTEVRRGSSPGREGRDHHPFSFTMLMAGGGVKAGTVIGKTDELGFHPVEDEVHIHNLHATILHLLGFDHTRLIVKHKGLDYRLTGVEGKVLENLIA
ncbi:hypothetical protein Pan241w_41120 [Gimesia alba]|uniref:Sulfatase n=1 Tax=Gimesia alba TaxID=2527973 RepID=A0A517RJG5_9PLAN|nr:DUF1501 domain-containing protein [Gimesia alba]QDT44008.1 hypothetical protein Pan241w_41120 [Gimesia alba]